MTDRRRGAARRGAPAAPTSWDPLARWYNGWVGEGGSEYHRQLAVPATLALLQPQRGETILDVGAGTGVLAPAIAAAGARYIGVDASPRLTDFARQHHGRAGQFIVGDARRLETLAPLRDLNVDAAVFLLSLQDMDPLERVVMASSRLLRAGGRAVLLLTHPAFRIPRQSGWGWDENRKLIYRRVDRYLSPLPVPMNPLPGKSREVTTRSFHRPLSQYVNALVAAGLFIDHMDEIPAHKLRVQGSSAHAESMARQEIPLFLALRAVKMG